MVLGRSAAAPYDSRLLVTLVKAEKEAHDSFKNYTGSMENATNALNGWAAADTGDSPDVLTVSNRVCELFDDAADAQKSYLISLMNYRSSLKDVAAREAEIRVILRDRDIFVSRLVKLNSKRTPTSESALESHNGKLEEARAELAACESTLKSEERALVGVKRRIFREALRMRMRAMAQLADVWRTTADRSIQILDSLEGGVDGSSMTDLRLVQPQNFPQQPAAPAAAPQSLAPTTPSTRFRDSRTIDGSVIFQSPEGSVIAPSHSASQMARKAAGYPDDYSEYGYEDDQSRTHEGTMLGATAPIQEEDEAGGSSVEGGDDGLNSQKYQVHVNTPLTPAQIAEQKARERAASVQQPIQRAPSARVNGVGNQAQPTRPVNGERTSPGAQPQGTAFPTQQQSFSPQPSPSATTAQSNGILGATVSSTGATAGQLPANDPNRKRVQSAPALQPAAQSGTRRETAEERSRRFSSLDTGAVAATYSGLTGPAPILPSATQYTLDAHSQRVAPEATLFLPSSDTRTKSYRVTQDESDEEMDEVGQLRSIAGSRSAKGGSRRGRSEDNESVGSYGGSTSRKLQSGRSARASAIYQQSDAGESTIAGRDKRQSKVRYESEHKGGLFSGLTGLFRRREATPVKRYDDDEDVTPQTSPRARKNSGSLLKKGGRKDADSDSDTPHHRSLVKVYNNPGRAAPMPLDWAALDTRQPTSRVIPTSRSWVPPPERQKAMSDIGLPRSSTTGTVKRKSSLKNPSASVAASVDGASVKKKKRSSTISGPTGYDAAALVSNVATSQARGNMGNVTTQNPAQKVTRSTPSLMSVVAPKAGDPAGMHLPDAKNPGLSTLQPISRNLGTLPAPTPASAEPLKKKKSLKKSTTSGNIAAGSTGLTPSSAAAPLRTSVTAPTIANLATKRSDSALAPPKPPASILSVGSDSSARRKSVRLASDTKFSEATYTNSGAPAQLNGSAVPSGILKDSTNSAGEWNVRSGEQDAYSSDEGGDEYAKIRAQLNRAERDWQQAGFVDKGKKRA